MSLRGRPLLKSTVCSTGDVHNSTGSDNQYRNQEGVVKVYSVDPIQDPRWAEFIDRHPSASVFHSTAWLKAIQRTYGYSSVAYTTSSPLEPLSNGVVFCQVQSWLTGRRLVSLPFSDHCEPLLDTPEAAESIAQRLRSEFEAGKWKYLELRPIYQTWRPERMTDEASFYLHELDLRPSEDELFRNTHKSCIQAQIRRAQRTAMQYECGNSEELRDAFYRLMVRTRRRHRLPPQPMSWFENLAAELGERLQIRLASTGGTQVASILTLQHGTTVVYKYGCSDERFNNLGATPFLFWKTIIEAKQAGMERIDFGRSDVENCGLIHFKSRWGTRCSQISYLRWSRNPGKQRVKRRSDGVLKDLFSIMPDALLKASGRILYRHIG